jgi:outer membrane protein OmpA-like peptidoglycan-associated protein
MIRKSLIALLLASTFAQSVLSQEVLLYRSDDVVDAREVARILGGQAATPPAGDALDGDEPIRTRSIRMLDAQQPPTRGFRLLDAPARAEGARVERVAHTAGAKRERTGPSALALPVQFTFDSANILPRARAQLDALAEGIKMLSPRQGVVIEGHTDAEGSEEYNLVLSQRRALAVKRYLVAAHGIDASRLQAVGFGKFRPLEGRDPYAIENRRVQVRGA